MKYKELQRIYDENFSLGYISGSNKSPIENRMVLISLVCYITHKNKLKNPDVTHYSVIINLGLPEKFLIGLSIVCSDFAYGCSEFPTFGLEGKDIIKEVRAILSSYLPF